MTKMRKMKKTPRATKHAARQKRPTPLLDSHSRAAEVSFGDPHGMADSWAHIEPVRAESAEDLSTGIIVRLDQQTFAQLRAHARRKGIGPTTLVRMWVLERLQAECAE
jgi:hypothetical protein